MKIYYDITRTFIERARGPSRASGMGQVAHSWGREITSSTSTKLVTGLPGSWVEEILQKEPDFAWMRSRIVTGPEAAGSRLIKATLARCGFDRRLQSRVQRLAAFRAAEQMARRGLEKIYREPQFQENRFVHHSPLPEPLPEHLPTCCVPIVTIYDIIPFIFRDSYSNAHRRAFSRTISSIAKNKAQVIVNSSDTRHSLVCFFGLDGASVHVVPLGSNPIITGVGTGKDSQIPSRPYALYVAGTGQRRKNVKGAIEGFHHFLKETGEEADLVIVGTGTEEFQEYADILAATPTCRIHCLGQVTGPTLVSLYGGARIGVYLSLYEGFGLPILEYMHRGIPVVCSRESSMSEVAGDAAFLVNSTDSRSIGAGLHAVWTDAYLRQKLIRLGRARAEKFSWEASARDLLLTYERILRAEN